MDDPPAHDGRRPWLRWAYLALAYLSIALGAVGVVLPGLPTTPFVLVAAWAASRGSKRLERWLYGHRHFGPALTAWQEQRAVPRRAKVVALVLLAASWSLLAAKGTPTAALVGLGVFFCGVASFLITRPEPQPRDEHTDEQ